MLGSFHEVEVVFVADLRLEGYYYTLPVSLLGDCDSQGEMRDLYSLIEVIPYIICKIFGMTRIILESRIGQPA